MHPHQHPRPRVSSTRSVAREVYTAAHDDSEIDELRQQLAALTARADGIEGLRAMMDRDLAYIKQRMDAQDHLLQALHITRSNHTQRLTRIEETLERIETEFRGKLETIITMLDRLTPPAEGP